MTTHVNLWFRFHSASFIRINITHTHYGELETCISEPSDQRTPNHEEVSLKKYGIIVE